jgi:hypothetical protein
MNQMSEEIKEEITETEEMKTIKELMEKVDQMVDPEQFAELEKKYKTLLNDYVNRRPAPKKPEKKPMRPVADIAREIANIGDGDMTNRAYIEKSLEYRNAYMHEFGKDPWTDFSQSGSDKATEQTKKVAQVFQQLLEDYPSPEDFRIKLHGMLRDDPAVVAILRDREKQNKKK